MIELNALLQTAPVALVVLDDDDLIRLITYEQM